MTTDRRDCPTGKVRHRTRAAALRHMAELIAKDGSVRMNVYPCRTCGYWHVGHARGLKADMRAAIRDGNKAAKAAKAARRQRRR